MAPLLIYETIGGRAATAAQLFKITAHNINITALIRLLRFLGFVPPRKISQKKL
ncbi:MAG: hypothetical protein O2967_13410 [Proteobacteria bacterium]|nr:hypothetical protein [Pseudomonadota bacterium]